MAKTLSNLVLFNVERRRDRCSGDAAVWRTQLSGLAVPNPIDQAGRPRRRSYFPTRQKGCPAGSAQTRQRRVDSSGREPDASVAACA